jgi:hypothetical protein
MKLLYILLLSVFLTNLTAQNKNGNIWVRQNYNNPIFLNWTDTTPQISVKKKLHGASLANQGAAVCNNRGELKFYANGCVIMDKNGKFLPNGTEINAGEVYSSYCWLNYPAHDNIVLLPKPEDTTRYVALHTASEKIVIWANDTFSITYPTMQFYYSEIDATLNNGLGDVIIKNEPVFRDTIMVLGIHACRHANGKDWWIIAPELLTLGFQRVLLTSKGVQYVGEQRFKAPFYYLDNTIGQINFSNDGTKYAIGSPSDGVHIFDFDRCSGLFSNLKTIAPANPRDFCTGLAFSPNSRFLYVTDGDRLFQYDLIADNIEKSKVTIDSFDGKHDGAYFYQCKIAPNGKIYIGTPSSNVMMHTIHKPNFKGKACDFRQHDLKLPEMSYNAFPNIPNYELGASDPNCKLPVAVKEKIELPKVIDVFPNPTNGLLHIVQRTIEVKKYTWSLFDQIGHQVFSQTLDNESNNVNLPQLPKGIYFWHVADGAKVLQQGKLVLLE